MPLSVLKSAADRSKWRDKFARFVWLWRNARYAEAHAMDAVRDERAADTLSQARDGSMGFSGSHPR